MGAAIDRFKARRALTRLGLRYPYNPTHTPETMVKIMAWMRLKKRVLERDCKSRNDQGRLKNLEMYIDEAIRSIGCERSDIELLAD